MKIIELTQGQRTIVDDWWFDGLSLHKWLAHYDSHTSGFYAERAENGKTISMHAVVAGTPKGMVTDHINGNTLDNRSENLRVCTAAQNNMNLKKRIDNTSGYKGVSPHGSGWRAQIGINKRVICLGTYKSPEDAARVYDEKAKELFGEFSRLNF